MTALDTIRALSAEDIFETWVENFGRAMEARDPERIAALFGDDGYWKDMLSFTWGYPTYRGREQIADALASTLEAADASRFRVAEKRAVARFVRRSARNVIEGFFEFDTRIGHGAGFVRLLHDPRDPTNPKIWLLLTTLQEIRGHEEKIGKHRVTGEEFSKNRIQGNWLDHRSRESRFDDRDPQVLIVGGGHSGLILAARLRHMGVDVLVVEKDARIGDVWRRRYHSLTLHNQVFANHMPYLRFPETWPVWVPKDKLADWLEYYANALELNVWTGTELLHADYDEADRRWTATLRLGDGSTRTMSCRHLVAAMGVSGSIPNIPELPGIEDFRGEVLHSNAFTSGAEYRGKNAVVLGTGNSGHDIAQDLCVNGANVTLLQRGPSCVVSLEPTATSVYGIYSEGLEVEDVDLLTAAIPYPVLEDSYKFLTNKARASDREMLEGLRKVGFETFYGDDDTGFHMMYLRGEGGYYIDVGCTELIARGEIDVVAAAAVDRFVESGLRLANGDVIPADLVVMATGFKNMQENIARLVGRDIADRVGKIWGFDEDYAMRNMWQRTAQKGFWVMGGGLIDARLFSRFLALQIVAELEHIAVP